MSPAPPLFRSPSRQQREHPSSQDRLWREAAVAISDADRSIRDKEGIIEAREVRLR